MTGSAGSIGTLSLLNRSSILSSMIVDFGGSNTFLLGQPYDSWKKGLVRVLAAEQSPLPVEVSCSRETNSPTERIVSSVLRVAILNYPQRAEQQTWGAHGLCASPWSAWYGNVICLLILKMNWPSCHQLCFTVSSF